MKSLFKNLLLAFMASAAFAWGRYAIDMAPEGERLIILPGTHQFKFLVFNDGAPEDGDVEMTAEVAGVHQNPYKETRTKYLSSGDGNAYTVAFDFEGLQAGLYEISAEVRQTGESGRLIATAATYFLVSPEVAPVSDMGVQTHLGKWGHVDQLLDSIRHVGFTRIRDEIYWTSIEKTPGKFAWPVWVDEWVRAAEARHIRPLLILDYGNPIAYPDYFPKGRSFPSEPESRALFVNYVAANVARYGHVIKDWEIWNEPNNVKPPVYLELLKEVYAKIHDLQPEATVVSCGGGGAGGGPSAAYIAPIVKNGGVDYQDAFSIHPYMAPANPDRGYGPCKGSPIKFVNVKSTCDFLNRFCEEHPRSDGKKLGFWITEVGWPTGAGRNACGELEQAANISRTMIQYRRSGAASALFIYDLLSDGIRHSNAEHNFGLLRNDLSPKPAFAAAAAFLRFVGERACTEIISDEPNIKAFRFGDVIVAYAVEKNGPYDLNGIQEARVSQWDGFELPLKPKDGKLTLKLSSLPVYIQTTP